MSEYPPSPKTSRLPWYPWIGNKRPFYGWIVVFCGSVTQFAQGIGMQGFSTYLGYFQSEFGWSKTAMSGARSITQVENSVLGPIGGFLVDRFGPRVVSLIGTLIMGSGMLLFGMTDSLWMFYFSNIIIAIGASLQGILTAMVAVNHWFRRKRTIAQSLMLIGFALAGVGGIPLLVALQGLFGWQIAAIFSGIFVLVTGIPCSMYMLRGPEQYGLLPDGDTSPVSQQIEKIGKHNTGGYSFTLKEALRTPVFWLLGIGNSMGMFGLAAVQTHIFLHLEEGVHLTHAAAALVWSVTCISNIPSRLIGGIFGDRFPKRIVMATTTLVMAVSVIVLAFATSMTMAIAFAIIFGIGWGARTPVMNAIQGDYFGTRSLGVIGGWVAILTLPFAIASPVVTGYMADYYGDYRLALILTAAITAIGGIMTFFAFPSKHPQTQYDSIVTR